MVQQQHMHAFTCIAVPDMREVIACIVIIRRCECTFGAGLQVKRGQAAIGKDKAVPIVIGEWLPYLLVCNAWPLSFGLCTRVGMHGDKAMLTGCMTFTQAPTRWWA